MTDALPHRLREPTDADVGFILSTWLKGATDAWNQARRTDVSRWATTGIRIGSFADLTRKFTRDAVVGILQRDTCRVIVACDVEEDDIIYGYAVAEPRKRIVHWVCTKHQFQGRGLANAMVDALLPDARQFGVTCTYLPSGFVAMQSKWPVRFDPQA